MVNSMTMDRTGMMGVTGMSPMTGSPMTYPTVPTMMSALPNMMMVPRGTIKVEKCTNGVKIHCCCSDSVAVSMVQNLCLMQQGQMVGCCVMMNGQNVCSINMCCCVCTVEKTADGVCISCTTGDATCCQVVQACAECCVTCCVTGCVCCVTMGGMPVCCGPCETMTTKKK
jgi:hypothetical protein